MVPHRTAIPAPVPRLVMNGLAGLMVMLALSLGCAQPTLVGEGHWVTTWGCGPQLTEPGNLPPVPLAGNTLRQFVHVTLGGKLLRAQFSNAYGTDPVTLKAVHVALSAGAGSAGNGDINPVTDKALTFRGAPSVTLQPGAAVHSDPFEFDLPPLTNLAVTIHFGDISATTLNGHPGSRTTSFIESGNVVRAASVADAARTAHWYILTGVDVFAGRSSRAIVILGDSITDGRGSTTDGNNRWPDNLARRLHTHALTAGVAVVNMGIGGNAVLTGGLGPTALARFDRDVLGQAGAGWLILFEGVNDIGGASASDSPVPPVATNLVAAYQQCTAKAQARNIRVYGATITPFGGSFYDSTAHESARQTVNTWIRTNHFLDGVIDFDAAVRDPLHPDRLLPAYDTGDHLHLNVEGYQKMADAVDLSLFTE